MEIMSLEKLIEEWHKDSKIDSTEPGKELLKNPNLHAKYSNQLIRHSLALKAQKHAYNAIRRSRSDYYSGRMSEAELTKNGLKPFALVLKADLATYMDADPALQEAEKKVAIHEEAVSFLMSVIKAIQGRSWDIRGYIDWIKYTQGGKDG